MRFEVKVGGVQVGWVNSPSALAAREFVRDHLRPDIPPGGGDEMWRCQDGRTVSVRNMSDAHVRNTLRLLIRKNRESAPVRARRQAILRSFYELAALARASHPVSPAIDGYDDHWRR